VWTTSKKPYYQNPAHAALGRGSFLPVSLGTHESHFDATEKHIVDAAEKRYQYIQQCPVQWTVKQKRLCIYRAEALFPRYYRMKELTVATRPENTMETVEQSLMRMFREGPEVSLKGSPTVSPMTAALWQILLLNICRYRN
jgi:hypothetical protein